MPFDVKRVKSKEKDNEVEILADLGQMFFFSAYIGGGIIVKHSLISLGPPKQDILIART